MAGSRGDADTALAEFTAALALHDRASEMPAERGRTLIARGVVQRRLKQRRAARATLTEAVSIFDRIAAPLWAARARAELDRISRRGPGSRELTAVGTRGATALRLSAPGRTFRSWPAADLAGHDLAPEPGGPAT